MASGSWNVSSADAGAEIITATSHDGRYPPSNVLDGNESTFWSTTGMCPQEILVRLAHVSDAKRVRIVCTNVAAFSIDRAAGDSAGGWEHVTATRLEDTRGEKQMQALDIDAKSVRILRFRIDEAFDDFPTIHSIVVEA